MGLATLTATRATCPRLSVGAVLVSPDHRLISTGYNGSVHGEPHCTEVGCLLNDQGRCVRTLHAEQNALLHAREPVEGATAYVTHDPCEVCTKLLRQAGVTRLLYAQSYPNQYSSVLRNGMAWELFVPEPRPDGRTECDGG